MVVELYQVPTWMLGADNKPSLQLFQSYTGVGQAMAVEAKTVEQPDLFSIVVRASSSGIQQADSRYTDEAVPGNENYHPQQFGTTNVILGNLIKWNNMWYTVENVKRLTENSVEITGALDSYLSFVCVLFNEDYSASDGVEKYQSLINPNSGLMDTTKISQHPVFFKRKHLNRYVNGNNVLYSVQKYLTNTDRNISISEYEKKTILASFDADTMYLDGGGNKSGMSYNQMFNVGWGGNNLYPYLLVKEGTEPNYISVNNGIDLGYALWPFNNINSSKSENDNVGSEDLDVVFENIQACSPFQGTAPTNPNEFNVFVNDSGIRKYIGNDYYIDLIGLPAPLWSGFKPNSPNGVTAVDLKYYNPPLAKALTSGSDPFYTSDGHNALMIMPENSNIYFYADVNQPSSESTMYTDLSEVNTFLNEEPALLNYVKCVAHLAGEDSAVNLTGFDYYLNDNKEIDFSYLFSFCISLNHPFTQISNIPYNEYMPPNDESFGMKPWAYNTTNEAVYMMNMKYTLPTLSNNWNNFLANNLSSYQTAINVSHYQVQEKQAQLAGAALSEIGDLFTGGPAAWFGIGGAVANMTGDYYGVKAQESEYNYLQTGKKADYSRVANERNATNGNAFPLYNTSLSWIFSVPVPQDRTAIINHYMLDGYQLDRFEPFYYWNNRQYWNYVQCAFFSDNLLPSLIRPYKDEIDKMMNKGIRIIMTAFENVCVENVNNSTSNGLNFGLFLNYGGKKLGNPENNKFGSEEINNLSYN